MKFCSALFCVRFRVFSRQHPLIRTSLRFLLSLILLFPLSPHLHAATSKNVMVVTSDSHATAAAVQILKQGGNAVDAAIAAQWVLNVTQPQATGIGGGGYLLFYDAIRKQTRFFDGGIKASMNAYPKMFYDENGLPFPRGPHWATGGLFVGVPGALMLLEKVHSELGSKRFSFPDLFNPAVALAERGFPVSKILARDIRRNQKRLKQFPGSAQIFFDSEGKGLRKGTILFQKQLAETLRQIQENGVRFLHQDDLAKEIVQTVQKSSVQPGVLSEEDLAGYEVKEREPVRGRYRGYDVVSAGPPSFGGITLITALHILESFDLGHYGKKMEGVHLLAEAQKITYRDGKRWMADPDYGKIPLEKLLSKTYAKEFSDGIRIDTVTAPSEEIVDPFHPGGSHTVHILVVDDYGNMVSLTSTLGPAFGSALMVPGRGFFLNSLMTDFDPIPYDENGNLRPDAPEGEKRPRSYVTPVFVLKDGRPFLAAGAVGGVMIPGAVLNVILGVIDHQLSLEEAILSPRVLNWNGLTALESRLHRDVPLRRGLEQLGHRIQRQASLGKIQAVYFDHQKGLIDGEGDPRGGGNAMGY